MTSEKALATALRPSIMLNLGMSTVDCIVRDRENVMQTIFKEAQIEW